MKFIHEVEINVAIDKVVELFLNVENLPLWQPDLIEANVVSGTYGQVGAETQLLYRMGEKQILMTQTVTNNNLPAFYTAVLETPNVWNLVEHSFHKLDDTTTLWVCKNEYKCSGFVRLLIMLMPNMFKKQSQASLSNFKHFAEQQIKKGN